MNKTTIATLSVSILAILIAVVSFNHAYYVSQPIPTPSPVSEKAGAVVAQDSYYFPYGINIGGNGSSVGKNLQSVYMPLIAGSAPFSNQASWCNTTGNVVYAMNYVGQIVGTTTAATSAGNFLFYVGTSTTATTSDGTVPGTAGFVGTLVNQYNIATGTIVTAGVINSDVKGGSLAQGVVALAPNVCLDSAIETATSSIAATSSLRGFNIQGSFDYTY